VDSYNGSEKIIDVVVQKGKGRSKGVGNGTVTPRVISKKTGAQGEISKGRSTETAKDPQRKRLSDCRFRWELTANYLKKVNSRAYQGGGEAWGNLSSSRRISVGLSSTLGTMRGKNPGCLRLSKSTYLIVRRGKRRSGVKGIGKSRVFLDALPRALTETSLHGV